MIKGEIKYLSILLFKHIVIYSIMLIFSYVLTLYTTNTQIIVACSIFIFLLALYLYSKISLDLLLTIPMNFSISILLLSNIIDSFGLNYISFTTFVFIMFVISYYFAKLYSNIFVKFDNNCCLKKFIFFLMSLICVGINFLYSKNIDILSIKEYYLIFVIIMTFLTIVIYNLKTSIYGVRFIALKYLHCSVKTFGIDKQKLFIETTFISNILVYVFSSMIFLLIVSIKDLDNSFLHLLGIFMLTTFFVIVLFLKFFTKLNFRFFKSSDSIDKLILIDRLTIYDHLYITLTSLFNYNLLEAIFRFGRYYSYTKNIEHKIEYLKEYFRFKDIYNIPVSELDGDERIKLSSAIELILLKKI